MPDGPDAPDVEPETPDAAGPSTEHPPSEPAPSEPAPKPLPVFNALDDLPPAPPQVQLINDRDLSWVDRPEISEEERERLRERRAAKRKKVYRQRRIRRTLKIGGALAATMLILTGILAYLTLSGLQRMPNISEHGGLNTPGTNILLIGRNPAEPLEPNGPGRAGWQNAMKSSDLVMVLHLTRDNKAMFVVSIPGDSVLPIPASQGAPARQGKLPDAYASGGANLYVRTIEEFTGARMDRVAVLDMAGLSEITNTLDGVIVEIPTDACNLPVGPRKFDGDSALVYSALYPCLNSDLDRVQRQQSLLRGLMRTAVDGNRTSNPFTLVRLLKSTAGHLTLEENFSYPSMLGQLFSMRGLRSATTTFLTIPVAADPFKDGKDSIIIDPARSDELFEALRADKLAEYLALNRDIETR